jgi:hypothetical protein
MEEDKVGVVITYPFEKADLWDGTIGVLCSGTEIIDIVKIDHLTLSGNYYVIGDKFTGVMHDHMYLAKLYVKNTDGKCYQLKFAQWKTAIKSKLVNNNKTIVYNLLHSPYDEGYYMRICIECGCHFSGGRKAQICEPCSIEKRFAKIVIDKTIKQKRPRIKKDESI